LEWEETKERGGKGGEEGENIKKKLVFSWRDAFWFDFLFVFCLIVFFLVSFEHQEACI